MAFAFCFLLILSSPKLLPADHVPQVCSGERPWDVECLGCDLSGVHCPEGEKCAEGRDAEGNSREECQRREEDSFGRKVRRSDRMGLPVCSSRNPGQVECLGCDLLNCLPGEKCRKLEERHWMSEHVCVLE